MSWDRWLIISGMIRTRKSGLTSRLLVQSAAARCVARHSRSCPCAPATTPAVGSCRSRSPHVSEETTAGRSYVSSGAWRCDTTLECWLGCRHSSSWWNMCWATFELICWVVNERCAEPINLQPLDEHTGRMNCENLLGCNYMEYGSSADVDAFRVNTAIVWHLIHLS